MLTGGCCQTNVATYLFKRIVTLMADWAVGDTSVHKLFCKLIQDTEFYSITKTKDAKIEVLKVSAYQFAYAILKYIKSPEDRNGVLRLPIMPTQRQPMQNIQSVYAQSI